MINVSDSECCRMGPRVREDDSVRELIRTPSCHSRACGDPFIHTCQKPRLEMHSPRQTTTKAKPTATPTMKCEKRATALAIRWVPAFARMTKIRKEKAELSSAAKNKKLSTPPPRPQLSFPRKRGSIHPHVPDAAFGNALAATDDN